MRSLQLATFYFVYKASRKNELVRGLEKSWTDFNVYADINNIMGLNVSVTEIDILKIIKSSKNVI